MVKKRKMKKEKMEKIALIKEKVKFMYTHRLEDEALSICIIFPYPYIDKVSDISNNVKCADTLEGFMYALQSQIQLVQDQLIDDMTDEIYDAFFEEGENLKEAIEMKYMNAQITVNYYTQCEDVECDSETWVVIGADELNELVNCKWMISS